MSQGAAGAAASGGDAPRSSRRATIAVAGAVAAAFALRVFLAVRFPEFDSGDSFFFRDVAEGIRAEGLLGPGDEKFARPPLYPWVVSFFRPGTGDDPWIALRVFQCALAAGAVWCVAGIARALFPVRPWIAVAAAWLYALDPSAAGSTKLLYSESLLNPLVLALVLVVVRGVASCSWRRAAAAALLGGLAIHVRADFAPALLALCAGAAVASRVRHAARWRALVPWAAAAAGALLLCVPWSLFATARTGQPTFIASAKTTRKAWLSHGWVVWNTTWVLPRHQALVPLWWVSWECDPAWLPDEVFGLPGEKERVRALIERARAAGGPVEEVEAGFEEIARERIDRAPLAFYVGNPVRRSLHAWLGVTDRDRPDTIAHARRSTFGRLHELGVTAWNAVGALGFLAAFVALVRFRRPEWLLAVVFDARVYSIYFAGPLLRQPFPEKRYATCVEPLAQILALWAAAEVAAWIMRRRAGAAGTS